MKRLTKKDVMDKIEIIDSKQKLSSEDLETIHNDTQEIIESLEKYLLEN